MTMPYWQLLGLHALLMVGLAATFTPVFTLGLGAVPPHLYAHGSSILGTLQQVAAAFGTALVVTVMSARAEAAQGRRRPPRPPPSTACGPRSWSPPRFAGGRRGLAVMLPSRPAPRPARACRPRRWSFLPRGAGGRACPVQRSKSEVGSATRSRTRCTSSRLGAGHAPGGSRCSSRQPSAQLGVEGTCSRRWEGRLLGDQRAPPAGPPLDAGHLTGRRRRSQVAGPVPARDRVAHHTEHLVAGARCRPPATRWRRQGRRRAAGRWVGAAG